MKICKRAYEYLQACHEDGRVSVCAWADYRLDEDRSVGNLTRESIKDILKGERWEEWINSFLDGSYCFCSPDKCLYMANDTLETVEYQGKPDYPKWFSISYDRSCNYTCPACRTHNIPTTKKEDADHIEKIRNEIRTFINDVRVLEANGRGEFFCSPSIIDLLAEWKPVSENPAFVMETNGSLFNEKNWEKIKQLGQYNLHVFITVMSFDNMAYQFLSGVKYDISRIEENLRFVKQLREKGLINRLTLATVVQERNFRMLPDFTRRCIEEFGADIVRLRSFYPFGVQPANIEWFFDVRNARHPYHKEYLEIMKDPIFKHPKVIHWVGDQTEVSWEIESERNTTQYNLTRGLFEDEDFAKQLTEFLKAKEIEEVYIYAAGVLGKVLACFMQSTEIRLKGFIDEYSSNQSYKGIPIYRMTHEGLDKSKLVIISLPTHCGCVEENLNKAGFENVTSLEKLIYDVKPCDCC